MAFQNRTGGVFNELPVQSQSETKCCRPMKLLLTASPRRISSAAAVVHNSQYRPLTFLPVVFQSSLEQPPVALIPPASWSEEADYGYYGYYLLLQIIIIIITKLRPIIIITKLRPIENAVY